MNGIKSRETAIEDSYLPRSAGRALSKGAFLPEARTGRFGLFSYALIKEDRPEEVLPAVSASMTKT